MQEQMQIRLAQLRQEYQKGEAQLQDLRGRKRLYARRS